MNQEQRQDDPGPQDGEIHGWFSLSYANYLVLPRTMLQSMPLKWQEQFVGLLSELETAFGEDYLPHHYTVHCRDSKNRFISDPCPPYERGRTRILRKAG